MKTRTCVHIAALAADAPDGIFASHNMRLP